MNDEALEEELELANLKLKQEEEEKERKLRRKFVYCCKRRTRCKRSNYCCGIFMGKRDD